MPGPVGERFGRAVDDLRTSVESATRVATLIRGHWWDVVGLAVAERVERVAGELERAADTIARLTRIVGDAPARQADQERRGGPDWEGGQGRSAEPPDGTGPLLPGLDGRRVDERRGVSLPSLDGYRSSH